MMVARAPRSASTIVHGKIAACGAGGIANHDGFVTRPVGRNVNEGTAVGKSGRQSAELSLRRARLPERPGKQLRMFARCRSEIADDDRRVGVLCAILPRGGVDRGCGRREGFEVDAPEAPRLLASAAKRKETIQREPASFGREWNCRCGTETCVELLGCRYRGRIAQNRTRQRRWSLRESCRSLRARRGLPDRVRPS